MIKIIFIHGINNHNKSSDIILEEWKSALKEGFEGFGKSWPTNVHFSAPYYGDLLKAETDEWGKSSDSSTRMSADSPDEDYLDFNTASIYLSMQERLGLSDEELKAFFEQEDNVNLRRQADGIHKRWLKAIARAFEDVLPTNGKYVAKLFLKQAAAYLNKVGCKAKIDDHVESQLFSPDLPPVSDYDKIIIISHSLGTIVAFTLLRNLWHKFSAKLLITAGSPLGINIVKSKLEESGPLSFRDNVDRWINISDPEDFVALKPKLQEEPYGSEVHEDYLVDNGEEDAHSIQEYLKSEPMIQELLNTIPDEYFA